MSLVALRKKLAQPQPSWQLCLLGLIGGTLASIFIIIFRFSVDKIQLLFLDKTDDYSTLSDFYIFITPLIAVSAILIVAKILGFKYTRMGIPFVIHRLKVAYGSIPFKNTLTQYFGGIFALAGGFSVGKEGPAVHIGAASSSFFGSYFSLPKNSVRTLCACGIAAGISTSFNTPLAAVIFVMEVILREYKLHVFVPVILASIIGSIMSNAFFGPYHEYEFFAFIDLDLWHYPFLIIAGMMLGTLATAFNKSLMAVVKLSDKLHMVKRLSLAAIIMASIAVLVPQSMGSGLNSVGFLFEQNPHVWLIFSLLIAKFIATVVVLGLGVPGGIIGPTLSIGAIAGALMGFGVSFIYADIHFVSDYALLGMAGMLAATLNAPLAALLAVIELSNQLQLALPAMVVITSAFLTSSQFFKNRSIFLQQLDYQGLAYQLAPVERTLQKHGVISQMETDFTVLEHNENAIIRQQFIELENNLQLIIKPAISGGEYRTVEIDLNIHPFADEDQALRYISMPGIDSQATLAEAYFALYENRQGAVYIYHRHQDKIIGYLTFDKIRKILTHGDN
ncbi:MAG: chloride channel protein [Thalassotalea sp.]|nr:chloride channel protein [Thalassotalea sp.]MDG2392916.1 chloride channel protein [Thalassotalea sp.]